jgi:hypothetical protein
MNRQDMPVIKYTVRLCRDAQPVKTVDVEYAGPSQPIPLEKIAACAVTKARFSPQFLAQPACWDADIQVQDGPLSGASFCLLFDPTSPTGREL